MNILNMNSRIHSIGNWPEYDMHLKTLNEISQKCVEIFDSPGEQTGAVIRDISSETFHIFWVFFLVTLIYYRYMFDEEKLNLKAVLS